MTKSGHGFYSPDSSWSCFSWHGSESWALEAVLGHSSCSELGQLRMLAGSIHFYRHTRLLQYRYQTWLHSIECREGTKRCKKHYSQRNLSFSELFSVIDWGFLPAPPLTCRNVQWGQTHWRRAGALTEVEPSWWRRQPLNQLGHQPAMKTN